MKKKDLVITIVFISILFLPNIVYWFVKDKMDNNNYENRVLYQKPILTFKDINNFANNYENYYNDNLPFKNEIRKIRSQILYTVFNTSSNERVIVGENGWYFFDSAKANDEDNISTYQKIVSYTNEQMNKAKEILVETQEKLKNQNRDFYILIAPDKENVYANYMPKSIKRNSNVEFSKVEELINYLNKETNLKMIYPKKELVENRSMNDTYFKYDTHWNNYGAYLGTMNLMQNIDPNFNIPTIEITKQKMSGDLANMNITFQKLMNDEPVVENFYNEIDFTCIEGKEYKNCTSNNAIYNQTILVIGDSFRKAMVQYLAKLYKNAIFIHRNYYNSQKLEEYNPDIVVLETVERYSDILLKFKIL